MSSNDGIDAGPDLQVAYFQNAHISTCAGTPFDGNPNCGTYLEIHQAQQVNSTAYLNVITDIPLMQGDTDGGYKTAYMDTTSLCFGDYEVWWVVRTRSGPYVQFIRPFSVISPSC